MRVQSRMLGGLQGIAHGFSTRQGGVSQGIYASLNCGLGSDDDPGDVAENRARFARELGVGPEALVTPYQVHSPDVAVVSETWSRGDAPKADAVVTARPGLAVAVSTADCVPVLFADEQAKIVGAAHSGWRGALSGVLEATLDAMERLGAARAHITAAIGPAISQEAYEVGGEFEEKFLEQDRASARFFRRESGASKPRFDLTGYAGARLASAGVGSVENLGMCTYRDEKRFFSYRRTCHLGEPDYGRQISAILIT